MEPRDDEAPQGRLNSTSTLSSTHTTKMPYTNCQTRILDLRHLRLPTDPATSDSTFRAIYKSYMASSRTKEKSVRDDARNLQSAITSLTSGIAPPVAFPTETVYGLGADATNPSSIAGIFAAKGRPADNPLIVHVSSIEHLERCLGGSEQRSAVPQAYRDLLTEFWPGPLTILIPVPEEGRGVKFAPNVHPGQKTIGFRVPRSEYARFLIACADRPIAAPSANSSGKPSPTTAQHVYDDLEGKVNFILDGGSCDVGVESTVVDGLCDPPLILRPGGLSKIDLREWGKKQNNVWQNVENGWEHKKGIKRKRDGQENKNGVVQKAVMLGNDVEGAADVFQSPATRSPAGEHSDLQLGHDDAEAPRAPGMKYKHYAPSGRMFLFEADSQLSGRQKLDAVYRKLRELIKAQDVESVPPIENTSHRRPTREWVPQTRVEESTRNLKIGILTSTSWPRLLDLQDKWQQLYPEWDDEDTDQSASGDKSGDLMRLRVGNDTAGFPRRDVEVRNIDLGKDAASVARNLFAGLRKCDEWGCEWILVEAPYRAPATNGSMSNSGSIDSQVGEDEFETVLERMRKAASEVVQSHLTPKPISLE
ncbi:hypothetical protein LTR70_001798 [Exophiala xenobiotica]|uniref:Threonylcarbamoyl-AMP synthase n=1 Tax=Lithohypha guttulata TaxID=1690604 RepID=A0ABR0KLX8_9EURO|nr:hypothetical protein LTR24_001009 [Lithohypha guttulata]KAK5327056.1 hypothetical protein LTR70_001798 [Exophiala xenobiotica]